MTPAEHTYLYFIENEGVLFHEPSQKLFHLNTTATFIWCLLEDKKLNTEILLELQDTFKLDMQTAENYLEATEGLLQSLGVLKDFEAPPQEKSKAFPQLEGVEYQKPQSVAESEYQLLSCFFRVKYSRKEYKEIADPILEHLKPNSTIKKNISIEVYADQDWIILARDQTPLLRCKSLQQLAPMVKSMLWIHTLHEHDFFLNIHAGVVGDRENVFVFPAAPGSGKSTLTSALVKQGFEYFSDEVAMFQEDFTVEPVPLAMCIKDTGTHVVADLYPDLPDRYLHHRVDGKFSRYIPPAPESVPVAGTQRPVAAIVFPRYEPETSESSLTPITKVHAIQRLMKECLMVDTHLDHEKVKQLINWLETTPTYELITSNLSQSVKLLSELSAETKKCQ